MKKFCLFALVFLFAGTFAYTQNASTYFPVSTGYKWYFKDTPLDSNNNPMTNLATYRVDSFAVVSIYNGLLASIAPYKSNLISTNQIAPYRDSSFHNFQGTNGWEFLTMNSLLDTIPIPSPGFLNFLHGLENWYSVYRFAQAVNSEYVIVTKDTTIAIDTVNAPIRVKLKAKRLNDETVSTVNGSYSSKKFLLTYGLYYRLLIFEIPIIEKPDTTWLAQNVWIVKQISPSTKVDLSGLGLPINFSVPGNKVELTLPTAGISNISTEIPPGYKLHQNFPNPFNPVTDIRFELPQNGFTNLSVYDIRGAKVDEIVNGMLGAGTFSVRWNASGFSSGVYFYKLSVNGQIIDTKKLVLTK